MPQVTGPFEVTILPQKPDNPPAEAAKLGRMSIDKQFHGDLEAESKGEMLALMSESKGSGGYVAMERVTGVLQGRSGSFALQHSAQHDAWCPAVERDGGARLRHGRSRRPDRNDAYSHRKRQALLRFRLQLARNPLTRS